MSYSLSLSGGGGSDGTPRRLAAGQLVTARFQPSGVNPSNTNVVTNALGAQMASTGVFKTPEYLGWGKDDNNGLIVFRAELKTGQFTPLEVANKIKAVMPALERALSAKRLTFLTIRHPTPSGENVPAATPDTPVTPEAGGGGGGSAAEEENFFTRKVGGVPVWAIGAGVLTLGAGLVLVATMRKKPAAIQANRRRASKRSLRPNDRRNEMEQYYRSAHGAADTRSRRALARQDAAYRMLDELTAPVTDSRGVTHMQGPDDRRAAYDLVREAYPDVDL